MVIRSTHVLFVLILVLSLLLSGCWGDRAEVYNENDELDFGGTSDATCAVRFNILQLEKSSRSYHFSETTLAFGHFLFVGVAKIRTVEGVSTRKYYYTLLSNLRGGTYFAQIPYEKVRIYQDLKSGDNPCFVGCYSGWNVLPNDEDKWEYYDKFNLHIPPGSIAKIPNLDLSINLEDFLP